MKFLRLFLSIYVIFLASIYRCIAEIAYFSRLQERVINVRWCCFCARLFLLGHCRTPRVRTGALRPVQVVSLLDTVVVCIVGGICFSWSIWPSSTGSEPILFIVSLLSLSNRGFMLSLSTVFVRLSFSHNCLCHCVLVLVCNYPATHPQVLTPDGFSEEFFNHLKVRYNMKKGLPEYSQLRAEIICIVRWGLISPQRPQFER